MSLRRLSVILDSITSSSYREMEDHFEQFAGVTNPGLDVPTLRLEMVYQPATVGKDFLLGEVAALGYEFGDVSDEEENQVFSFLRWSRSCSRR